MITAIFETTQFRVQIVGKSAWVESSEGAGWILRNQYSLPLALDTLQAQNDPTTAALRLAVEHFERTRNGNQALRTALTLVRNAAKPSITEARSLPAQRSKRTLRSGLPRRVSPKPHDFRAPLRPPLAAQEPTSN